MPRGFLIRTAISGVKMVKQFWIAAFFPVLCAAAVFSNAQAQDASPASAAINAAPRAQDKAADRALRKDVVRALSRTKGLNTTRITVRAKSGAVMLEGSVPDQSEVDVATQAATHVSGVTSVKNTLTVVGPAGSE